jgi:hypothetical protein
MSLAFASANPHQFETSGSGTTAEPPLGLPLVMTAKETLEDVGVDG